MRIAIWVQCLVADHGILYSRLCQLCAGDASDLATALTEPRRRDVTVVRFQTLVGARQAERCS